MCSVGWGVRRRCKSCGRGGNTRDVLQCAVLQEGGSAALDFCREELGAHPVQGGIVF